MGIAYHVTEHKYRRLLTELANGNHVDLANYGRRLGEVTNVTDMDAREAAYQLQQLEGKQ
jgi:hypothetical protein